jgi:hypothetical protein
VEAENFRIPLVIWQLVGSYFLSMVTLNFVFHHVMTWVQFFPKKTLHTLFLSSSGCENSPKESYLCLIDTHLPLINHMPKRTPHLELIEKVEIAFPRR